MIKSSLNSEFNNPAPPGALTTSIGKVIMNKVTITKTIKFPGEYTYELSNDHKIMISHDEYLREWHLSGIDKDGNNYEPCHPFQILDPFPEIRVFRR